LGLEIDSLIVKDNVCDKSTFSLAFYSSFRILSVKNTFHFKISNSIYSKNVFLTSNYIDNTAYIEIRNTTVDSKDIKYYGFVNTNPTDQSL